MGKLASQSRNYTPPARAVAMYEKDYHLNYKFPVDLIDSSEVRYAQFLYRLQEDSVHPKSGNASKHDFAKDFLALQEMKLPIFWERELDVSANKLFKNRFHENFIFLMKWMQSNGDLGRITEVRSYFELFMNEKNSKVNVSIFTPAMTKLGASKPWLTEKAKKFIKSEPRLLRKKGYELSFSFHTDSTLRLPKGEVEKNLENVHFYIEVAGVRINHEPALSMEETAAKQHKESNIDYSKIKVAKAIIETAWDGGVETSVLSAYFEQLAKTDQEEQLYGV